MGAFVLFFGVIAVFSCICYAMAESMEDSDNKKAALEAQAKDRVARLKLDEEATRERIAARRPEALVTLLREEFPALAENFTYTRCQDILAWYGRRGGPAAATAIAEVGPEQADRLMGMLFARETAPSVSEAFARHAEARPSETWRTLRRCIEASEIRARG